MALHPLAGKPAPRSMLVDVPRLVSAYYTDSPDPDDSSQQVSFGTSGHRGSSLKCSFNEQHILAITQAIVEYRAAQGIDGPLYLGADTHALSEPARRSALEVLAAHDVDVFIDDNDGYTPTPVISHAILGHNRDASTARADGIVITPSHNPPEDGGFKYNPPHGGPAGSDVTKCIEDRANAVLRANNREVKRVGLSAALRCQSTHRHDFITPYVGDLASVVDMEAIRNSGLKIGVDPLGGAGINYWAPIAECYGLDLDIVNDAVDPTFSFMSVDKDGKIRMDCSSPWAMASLIGLKDKYDIAFGNDTDYDRHGIVTRSGGLLNPNHYLSVAIAYLFRHRPKWPTQATVGKTLVSSSMIDRVAESMNRPLYEVPVGFKWFVPGLADGSCGFGGEESAGASFLRHDGTVWSTDKDGFILDLLAAEITARSGKDPSALYADLTGRFGDPIYERLDAPATGPQKAVLGRLSPEQVSADSLAGEPIISRLTRAPGNDAPIGGLKVVTENSWFAARPSGTEEIYKIYAESFRGRAHLEQVQDEARQIVADVFRGAGA